MTEDRLIELLNTKSDVTFHLLHFEELPLEKKLKVLSLRSKTTQYGVKLLIEIDAGFLFLPARYTDLFSNSAQPVNDNFYIKTNATYMTVLGFHREKFPTSDELDASSGEQGYSTPILQFTKEASIFAGGKRGHSHAPLKPRKTGTGNLSLDVLAGAAKAFEEAAAVGTGTAHVRALDFNETGASGSQVQ